jgi:diguanylate cyclase (GGDEF)-like protein
VATAEPEPPSIEAPLDEAQERLRAFRCAFECDLPGTREEFARMFELAESRGWPEVARASLYGMLRHAAEPPDGDPWADLERFLERSLADKDHDMVALALAWRAYLGVTRQAELAQRRASTEVAEVDLTGLADDDLAKAAVMLEAAEGNPVVKATAHFRVAFSFWQKHLWELADEQFAAAEAMVDAVDPFAKDPLLYRAALAFDRVLVQLERASALREVGDDEGVERCREEGMAAITECECLDTPEVWRTHLRAAAIGLDVLAGRDRSADLEELLARASGGRAGDEALKEWEAFFWLAKSLNMASHGAAPAVMKEALEAAERSIELWESNGQPLESPDYYLALHQAAALEAGIAGRRTAGLRSAESLAAQREKNRRSALAGMRALLASEKLRGERDTLAFHAYRDPLTGLANRRGFDRHVSSLVSSGAQEAALLLFDVDDFKPVNDRFGHLAGDEVLRRLARVLTANVRAGDFAARIGGDEFLLVLGSSSLPAACKRAEEIAEEVANQRWAEIDPELSVTVSFGVAVGHPSGMEALYHEADTALYRAKGEPAGFERPAIARPQAF